jgi:type VI secretion system protein ImpL
MWVWILAAVLLTAIWVGGYFLSLPLWIEIAASVFVVLLVVGILVFRRLRAVRAAKALEREIMRQAAQQAANTRPDRRAEIVELQEQIQKGIASLKSSKLGNVSGAAALYALPWYVIIGPPGAGKTTALKQSGLEFPFSDPRSGGGIRGVGGTRNCDWWFTNEAILLDTAGRYATEQDDHEEWIAFLGMLRKFRAKKPINGVLVAVSVADLAQATEEQIDGYAKKLRARIDEVMTRLEMVVPVYVMFTKSDLIAGFVEFFGDLRKSERGQTWGATFNLDTPVGFDPARAFEREFDTLVETLHSRGVKRIGSERVFESRQKIFQFPLEFQSLRSNLAEFVGGLFQKNTFQETPIFRGVYFTSGTQEGRPMDRVLGSMARAFGLRPQDTPATDQAKTESKSYFVTDLFRKVAFPDQNVAARTARESRRQRLRRVLYATAAVFIAVMLIIPSSCTYVRNKDLVDSTADIAGKATKVKWEDGGNIPEKADKLTGIKNRLKQLDDWKHDGHPVSMGWGMYSGDKLYEPLRNVYLSILDRGLRVPVQPMLEAHIRGIDPTSARRPEIYNFTYEDLKLLLMMQDIRNLNREWAAPKLTKAWATALKKPDDKEAEDALRPHVEYYLELLERKEVKPWKSDDGLISKTRTILLQVPQLDREYENMVRDANNEIAAITKESIFYGSIAPYVASKKGIKVDGAYTRLGWAKVRNLLEVQQTQLNAERWVLGEESIGSQVEVMKQIVKLRELYFERYKNAWRDFIMDLDVQKPDNSEKALDELQALSEPPPPYLRLMQVVDDNVTLDVGAADEAPGAVEQGLLDKGAQKLKQKTGSLGVDAGVDPLKPKKPGGRPISPVEAAFKPFTKFGISAEQPKEGATPPPTGLSQYQALVAKVVGVLSDLKDSKAAPDPKAISSEFENAFRTTSALLTDQDGFTRPMLSPLLMNPITLAWGAVLHDSGGAGSALWKINVYDIYEKTLDKKYPFAPESPIDAKLEDYTNFFKPKDGLVWGFYDAYLKGQLDEQGGTFVPSKRFKGEIAFSPPFLKCLKRTLEITKATFPDPKASPKPAVQFEVNLHSVSENVSHVSLEIDGTGHEYKNEPEEWVKLQWPAEKAETHGAKLRVRGIAGLDEEIARAGDFGFFRLLDAASEIKPAPIKAGEQPSLIAEWQLKTQSAAVRLNIRPLKRDNPLEKNVFAGFTCPRLTVASK